MREAWVDGLFEFVPPERVLEKEPMRAHTTFRVGGGAEAFVEVCSTTELEGLIGYAREKQIPYYVIGNGSNLLVSDEGFPGLILHIGRAMGHMDLAAEADIHPQLGGGAARTPEGEEIVVIRAGAGAMLSQVAAYALEHELTGLEFAAGIPGSLGGAVYMNAGAFGGEMSQVIRVARCLDEQGEEVLLSAAELELKYRESVLSRRDLVVLEVYLGLRRGNKPQIEETMQEIAVKRREKQPLEYPSAGSTFKRPDGNFAGKLIEEAGLKGYRIGGAMVSTKHCGFVINYDHATAMDIWQLMCEIVRKVELNSGIRLEPEVIQLGNFT